MATILIVDDDTAMREAMAEAVRDLGHDPRAAMSGRAALELLECESATAVFLDLRMPGMDGLEVLRRIRARPQPPPVTVLTAHLPRRTRSRQCAWAPSTISQSRLAARTCCVCSIG
jgi:CheY-like chemotaxis protein